MLSEFMLNVAWYLTFAIFFMHVGIKVFASLKAQRLIGRDGSYENYRYLADKISGDLYNGPGVIHRFSVFALTGVFVCVTLYFILLLNGQ